MANGKRKVAIGIQHSEKGGVPVEASSETPMETVGCLICRKHRNPDAMAMTVYESPAVVASLMTSGAEERRAYLGYAIVETRRHAPGLGDLSGAEARAFGEAINRVSAALKAALPAEHVYAYIQGDGVPHLHMHLVPRHAGTPDSYRHPMHCLQWPEAPRGGSAELEAIRTRIRNAVKGAAE